MATRTTTGRRAFLKTALAGTAALGAEALCERTVHAADRPNIVLIVSDDHGTDALGCWGNPVVHTPALDALAADGVRFTHAFCTTASCSPSRATILSGMHNHANGMYGLQHTYHHFQSFDTVKSLPVRLTDAGYRTARVGKFHVSPEEVYRFETVLSEGRANNMQALGRSPVEMADTCRDFIAAGDDRPFFLFFCMDDPHRGIPFDTWPEPNDFGNRDDGYPGVTKDACRAEDVIVPPYLPDTPECRAELAEYYQSVSRMDQGVGRLIDHLKRTGRYDNTVIIYLSDNGIAFPGAKTTLYEPGMRLPCIIRDPASGGYGGDCDAMISWVDIAPTILDYAGSPGEEGFHGRSFRAAIGTEHPRGFDEVYGSHTFHEITMYYPMRVVRNRRYKLIWNLAHDLEFPFAADLKQSSAWQSVIRRGNTVYGRRSVDALLHRPLYELYDLEHDPDEVNNLADDPRLRPVMIDLLRKLDEFQRDTDDPWGAYIGL
jgi:N-sulfoglucosamine sulfohydrolase